ncbi:MAG: anthranilate synthase component I family protein [Bacteroidota bacterium]|nr:anthranilate synthase component I family protein [Bacteroidota bacterium]
MNQDSDSKSTKTIPQGLFALFHSSRNGIFLQHNGSENPSFDWMAGFGMEKEFIGGEQKDLFEELQPFLRADKNIFGHFSYDLKNATEALSSKHFSGMEFPAAYFFIPELIAVKTKEHFHIESADKLLLEKFHSNEPIKIHNSSSAELILQERTTKDNYLSNVNALLAHIHRGDIYEINYCIEFYAEHVSIDPPAVYRKLNELCEAPFSVLYKYDQQWLMCASPERFLKKTGAKLISQPIKGTRPRGKNAVEDEFLKKELLNDPKERSENVMIVDLVRNDLSRSAKKGTVKVEELFGIHSFKNVHQMISTVTAELDEAVHPVQAIKHAFPMGSMTGAPKIRAMQLTEEFENMKRGLYSGAVGYFTPQMDFDFNVVIRSIQYNAKTGYLSLMVGSAITANSDPEKEYAECLVKAKTLFQSLGVKTME